MAGVNVVMSATTYKYVNDIKTAQDQSNKSFKNIQDRATKMGTGVSDAFGLPSNAISGFLGRLGPVGLAVGVVGGAAFGAGMKISEMGAQVMVTQKQIESMARASGLTIQQVTELGAAAQTVGIDFESMADISKDVMDRIGDNISTNGGALVDFWDTIKGKSEMTINDLKGLGGIDALRRIQQELDYVGASAAQQTFVLESISSNASKLTPILRLNEQEIKSMLAGYATLTANLSDQTIKDIERMQHNTEKLSNNFSVAMTESFKGLMGMTDKTIKYLSDATARWADGAKQSNISDDYRSGKTVTDNDLLSSAATIRDDILNEVRVEAKRQTAEYAKANGMSQQWYASELAKMENEITTKLAQQKLEKLRGDIINAGDGVNAEHISSDKYGTQGNKPTASYGSSSDANKALAENGKRRIQIMADIGKTETEIQNAIGEKSKIAYQGRLKEQQDELRANAEEQRGIIEAQGKFAQEAAQKRFAARAVLNKTEEDSAKYSYQAQLNQLNQFLQEGSISQSEFDTAKIIAEQSLQDKLADIREKARLKELDEERKAFSEQQAILQGKLGFAVIAQERADLELEIAVHDAENQMSVLNDKAGNEIITEQMKQDKISTLRQEHRDKEIERDLIDVQGAEQRDVLKWEMKRQFLDEQYELGLISEQAYQDKTVEIEANATAAKRSLIQAQLGTMSELFSGMSQNLKEGSKMQKAAFAMEKASTIANVTLSTFDAMAAIDKDPSLPTMMSKNIAKIAAVAQGAAQVAGATAVTLGQFHSGTDSAPANGEIGNTGSYILKGGERVVQPEANKDLTSYLENNKSSGSGETIINSDFIVQGNLDGADQDRFIQMCLQHRDIISGAVRQSNMETGN